ncbi:RraA family protein [Streptomyces sp. NPDC002133]|uniref:RraA family protein n=1 Tax=Streptomyces sp. NPDC002133 TaxID=3154409 RepID=UPI00332D2307
MKNTTEIDGASVGPRLAALGCAALVDAMGRVHGHRSHILPLVSPDPSRYLFGPAVTISYMPYRDDVEQSSETFADFFYRAVGSSPSGRVLVLSGGGYPDVSLGGGTKLSRVANQGLAGVLADGRLRDFSQLREYGISTWCRGESTRWGGDTVMPYAANGTVEFAGVCIVPGDYIFSDASGAVVVPSRSLHRVLEVAHEIDAEDSGFVQEIRSEKNPLLGRP